VRRQGGVSVAGWVKNARQQFAKEDGHGDTQGNEHCRAGGVLSCIGGLANRELGGVRAKWGCSVGRRSALSYHHQPRRF
jgi:hypothetical protein